MARTFVLLSLLALLALVGSARVPTTRAAPLAIVVTSTADVLPEETPATCPHESLCTLRAAIEAANAAANPDGAIITFDPAVFPAATAAAIVVGETALPAVTATGVTIDGAGAGVVLTSPAAPVGLELAGANAIVRALVVRGFDQACISVTGPGATIGGNATDGARNTLGGCSVGVALRGPEATVAGNAIGFADGAWAASTVAVGVAIEAPDAVVGDGGGGPAFGNVIAHAGTAIRVGTGLAADPAVTGTRIARNSIGQSPPGEPAPVVTGLLILPPTSGAEVIANAFANTNGSAIVVGADVEGLSTTGNRLAGNAFAAIAGRAIDLGGDGIRNPNDPGDADTGPNGLMNHPTILSATQASVSGFGGHACNAPALPCTIELYFAAHTPGSLDDPGSEPVPLGTVQTDAVGNFVLNNPPVAAGQWLVALATDQGSNTSEFGPPARVGAGTVACGNVSFPAGWNHSGYFGAQPLQLGLVFPPGTGGHVNSIHEFVDGTTGYLLWPEGTIIGRTLNTLVPPQPYWFNVRTPFVLQGGFAVSQALPVDLEAGWNDFVYVGGTADVRDALSSISGKYTAIYRYVNTGTGQSWEHFGSPETPGWARDFTDMESCKTYMVYVTEATTLTPLQP